MEFSPIYCHDTQLDQLHRWPKVQLYWTKVPESLLQLPEWLNMLPWWHGPHGRCTAAYIICSMRPHIGLEHIHWAQPGQHPGMPCSWSTGTEAWLTYGMLLYWLSSVIPWYTKMLPGWPSSVHAPHNFWSTWLAALMNRTQCCLENIWMYCLDELVEVHCGLEDPATERFSKSTSLATRATKGWSTMFQNWLLV